MAKNDDLEVEGGGIIRLLRRVEKEHDYTHYPNSPSIYKAPSTLRDLSPSSFHPRVVSIGPLHRDDANLKAFEAQKVTYLHKLSQRVRPGALEACVQKVASSIDRIKACYAGMIKTYDDVELTEMMVMDARFILEFLNQVYHETISRNIWLAQYIVYDLVLLENQIPFFVLNDVFQCTIHPVEPNIDLAKFIHPLLNNLYFFDATLQISSIHIDDAHDHILGVLQNCYKLPRGATNYSSDFTFAGTEVLFHTAVQLDRAGVDFKPNKVTAAGLDFMPNEDTAVELDRAGEDLKANEATGAWVMAMEVTQHRGTWCSWSYCKATLRVPVLRIDHFTELIIRNLIAYEHSSLSLVPKYITSYVFAMDKLIDNQKDIAKLMESKVLINHIGSHEDTANMINNLCKGVVKLEETFYYNQWKQLDKHCNRFWPKNISMLRSTYFSNPWSAIALLAGIVLFVLTMIQTYYAIKPAGSNRKD